MARLAKNFGVSKILLIRPEVDLSVAAVYAAHGADVLYEAEVTDFRRLRKSHDLLVATTAVRATRKGNVTRRTIEPGKAAIHARSARSASIVLGRETTGLKNREIELCDIVTSINTGSNYGTLNVSHAAAILLYTVSRARPDTVPIQSRVSRELFARHLHELAVLSKFQEHKTDKLIEIAKRIAVNSHLGEKEMLMMTGIFKKAIWRIEQQARHMRSKT